MIGPQLLWGILVGFRLMFVIKALILHSSTFNDRVVSQKSRTLNETLAYSSSDEIVHILLYISKGEHMCVHV